MQQQHYVIVVLGVNVGICALSIYWNYAAWRSGNNARKLLTEAKTISDRAAHAFAENIMLKKFLADQGYEVSITSHVVDADGNSVEGTITPPGNWYATPSKRTDH